MTFQSYPILQKFMRKGFWVKMQIRNVNFFKFDICHSRSSEKTLNIFNHFYLKFIILQHTRTIIGIARETNTRIRVIITYIEKSFYLSRYYLNRIDYLWIWVTVICITVTTICIRVKIIWICQEQISVIQ